MGDAIEIEVDDKVVRVSSPDRIYFPERGWTKLDLVEYYLAVGDGIVNALYERPHECDRSSNPAGGELATFQHPSKVAKSPLSRGIGR